jgi:predicted RNA-binding Zn-ribbon protein involved in translation (DUF1610 family)
MKILLTNLYRLLGVLATIATLVAFFFPSYVPEQTRNAVAKFIVFLKANPYGSLITVICIVLLYGSVKLIGTVIELTNRSKLFPQCGLYWNADLQPFCTKCKEPVSVHDDDESFRCNSCGRIIFPSIGTKNASITQAINLVKTKIGR